MKIGFFDSGLGGLTVLKESINKLPNEDYIYLADNLNAPYGIKEKSVVKEYIFKNIEKLVEKGAEIIVIACNTATSIAIDDLRNKYKDIRIIGTEPAVKPAIEYIKNTDLRVLVTATSLTLKEEKLKILINELHGENITDLLPLGDLVIYAENGEYNNEKIENYLKQQLKDKDIKKYGAVVLGCTHFPLFKSNFKNIFPKKTKIIDGSVGIVNNLKRNLNSNSKKGSITVLMTKESSIFKQNASRILQKDDIRFKNIK